MIDPSAFAPIGIIGLLVIAGLVVYLNLRGPGR